MGTDGHVQLLVISCVCTLLCWVLWKLMGMADDRRGKVLILGLLVVTALVTLSGFIKSIGYLIGLF